MNNFIDFKIHLKTNKLFLGSPYFNIFIKSPSEKVAINNYCQVIRKKYQKLVAQLFATHDL